MKELAEALRELTYDHGIILGRIRQLTDLLMKEPSSGQEETISFFKKAVSPHFESEEARAFPVSLKLRPSEGPLINELL